MTGEQSGYVLSFAGEEPVLANEMGASLVAAVLVAA
jgi:hypothetical protein